MGITFDTCRSIAPQQDIVIPTNMKCVIALALLGLAVLAAAEPGYGYYGRGYGHGYGHGYGYYRGKRSADAEPTAVAEAEAEPGYGYYGHGYGGGYGYGGYGYGRGYGYGHA